MLDSNFLRPYRAAQDIFPNLLARSTYLSKYSRSGESWTDTVARCVLGNVAEDPSVTASEAHALFDIIWNGYALPPGRGLWTGGVGGMPAEAYYNCYGMTLRSIDDWCWTADMLMCGGGVGVSLLACHELPTVAPGQARLGILCSRSHPNKNEVLPDDPSWTCSNHYNVEDSRQGWIQALRLALEHAFAGTSLQINVSSVRSRGTPIKTFGGVACGPGPLVNLVREVWAIVRGAAGRKLRSVECLDITNLIGVCIKSGNVRRSALLVLGNADDKAFRTAKQDWNAVRSHRHSSNNSIVFDRPEQFDEFDWHELVEDNAVYGEPGILNLWKIRKTDPGAEIINPCQPAWATLLTPNGITTMGDIQVGDTIWSGQRWTKVTRKVATGVKPVYAYRTTAGTFYGTENHRVVSNGVKVEARDADAIDIAPCAEAVIDDRLSPHDIMDGLVIGDGTVHDASGGLVVLCVGEKDCDYFSSEVKGLFKQTRPGIKRYAHEVETSITRDELPCTYDRWVPRRYFDIRRSAGFLRGLFSANGSVVANRINLKATSFKLIEAVQQMLSALGIASYYTTNKPTVVDFANGSYLCKQSYDLSIGTRDSRERFARHIGFLQEYKNEKLRKLQASAQKPSRPKRTFDVSVVEKVSEEEVYDITVDAAEHTYWTGGMCVSNCGEIPLHHREACCLSEVYPARFHPSRRGEVLRLITRYTLRQRMRSLTDRTADLTRTNNMRIGVGLGGVCDFAWTSEDLVEMYDVVRKEAHRYADDLGVARPIACTTVKPSGCRPWYALTTTTAGILTLEELFEEHPVGQDWAEITRDVCAIQGAPTKDRITRTYANGKASIYRIRMACGLQVESTPNHQWYVLGHHNHRLSGEAGWRRADEIRPGDVLDVQLGVYDVTAHAPLREASSLSFRMRADVAEIRQPGAMSPELAWFFGYLWGDGAMSPSKYRLRFIDQRVTNLEKAAQVLRTAFGIDAEIRPTSGARKAHVLEFGSKLLWHWLIKNGVWKYDVNRLDLIPRCVRSSSKEDIIAFIAGLVDSDGWAGTTNKAACKFVISTADERFARHLQDVAWAVGLGLYNSHNSRGRSKQAKKSMYTVGSTNFMEHEAFQLLAKHSTKIAPLSDVTRWGFHNPTNRRVMGKVETVEVCEEQETYDIEVENTHWYRAGAVRSHNTISLLVGSSPGIHAPFAPYYLRRTRIATNEPMAQALREAGVPCEPCVYDQTGNTLVFAFPMMARHNAETVQTETVESQICRQIYVQRSWADNAVSTTISFKEHEKERLAELLRQNAKDMKSISCLPKSHGYEQPPYEAITADQFAELWTKINHDHPLTKEGGELEIDECSTGACPVR